MRVMHKCFCVGGFVVLLTASSVFAADKTVEQWGVFEVALSGPTNGNPFLDVKGNYNGLFYGNDGVEQESAGYLRRRLTVDVFG